MYRIFCCRNRKTSRVEVDTITDSLETCLSVDRGVAQFRSFLERNNFGDQLTTLEFVLKCQEIQTELSRLSPRDRGLPERIRRDVRTLYEMTNDINFDFHEMNTFNNFMRDLDSTDVEEKKRTLEAARGSAVNLLRPEYNMFRIETLRTV